MRSFTFGFPPRPFSRCFAVTQPFEPLFVEVRPVQPSAMVAGCPPGCPFIELSLYQLFGSPFTPTFSQVAPLSIEYCKTAPSQLNSEFHQIFISTTGCTNVLMLKHGLSTKERSL